MTDQLQPIPFHQDTIFVIDQDGQPFVPLRPICENLGLDWASQYRKLTSREKRWSVVMLTTVAGDGKQREMLCIPIEKTTGWLFSIDSDKVNPDLKEKVEMYQEECGKVLWNYWANGKAVNPRHAPVEVPAGMMLVTVLEHIGLYQRINTLNEEAKDLLRQRIEDVNNKNVKRLNFTAEEDAKVLELLAKGLSHSEIGKEIGRNRNSVCSSIRRQKGLRS